MGTAPRLPLAILGGGVTGLAAGLATAAPVFERSDGPGGICRSYYLRPGDTRPLDRPPPEDDAYRFEVGGGHWIFGGDAAVLTLLADLAPMRTYRRRAVVRLGDLTVPYPLQDNVHLLGGAIAGRVDSDRGATAAAGNATTMHEWLLHAFGPTLCGLFFHPFNERYTAGLTRVVAHQDAYKSPASLPMRPARLGRATRPGYNATFAYPRAGLDSLGRALAVRCDIRYGAAVVGIDTGARVLQLAGGSEVAYDALVSTLPLVESTRLAGLEVEDPPDPYTSVLVLNIGARRGDRCPRAHWQYEADSASGFHRIGFYSNVDPSFLPRPHRRRSSHVSLYVERAYLPSDRPTPEQTTAYSDAVVAELRERGYVEDVEVVDPSWVEMAYTWQLPASRWRNQALAALQRHGIHSIGRYGAWKFQGIADSVRDGLAATSLPRTAPAPLLDPA